MIKESVRLFQVLPAMLKWVWALLLTGLFWCGMGYFTGDGTQSVIGATLLVAGYGVAIMDLFFRKKNRGRAAQFYTGLTVALLVSSVVIVFFALLAALVLAVVSITKGYSEGNLFRMLHFLALIFAFLVVGGIPHLAKAASRDETETRAEEDSPGRSATAPEPDAE